MSVAFDDAEPTDNYGGIYQYDPLGWTDQGCFGDGSSTDWCANAFTAAADSQLAAVGFYAIEPGTSYSLYVGVGSSSTMTAAGSGTLPMGYHTLALELAGAARRAARGSWWPCSSRHPGTTIPSPSSIPSPAGRAPPVPLRARATSARTARAGPT